MPHPSLKMKPERREKLFAAAPREFAELGFEQVPLALVSRLLEHGKVIGAVRDDLPTSLLIEAAMGMGMAIDRRALEHASAWSPEEMNAFQARILDMFVRLLAPRGYDGVL